MLGGGILGGGMLGSLTSSGTAELSATSSLTLSSYASGISITVQIPTLLNIDIDTGRLLNRAELGGGITTLRFFQGDTNHFYVKFWKRQGASYVAQATTGYTVKIGVAGGNGVPTGTVADPPNLFETGSFSFVAPNTYIGDLYFTPSVMDSFIGTMTGRASTFEVELTGGAGNKITALQRSCLLSAEGIE